MYDPMRYWGATKGKQMTVGIVGVGGLGTMGIKIAKALGHKVVAVSRTADKEALALSKGADFYVASSDKESISKQAKKVDLLLNTISANHDLNVYLPLMNTNGVVVQLGACLTPHPISQVALIFSRIAITGNAAGGT